MSWGLRVARTPLPILLAALTTGVGGGIANYWDLTLADTAVMHNRASEAGGGIYNGSFGGGSPAGTIAIDAASSVSDNAPDDCVGTSAC